MSEEDDREYQSMVSMSQAAQEAADAMKKLSAAVQNFRFSVAELAAALYPGKDLREAEEVAAQVIRRAKREGKK